MDHSQRLRNEAQEMGLLLIILVLLTPRSLMPWPTEKVLLPIALLALLFPRPLAALRRALSYVFAPIFSRMTPIWLTILYWTIFVPAAIWATRSKRRELSLSRGSLKGLRPREHQFQAGDLERMF